MERRVEVRCRSPKAGVTHISCYYEHFWRHHQIWRILTTSRDEWNPSRFDVIPIIYVRLYLCLWWMLIHFERTPKSKIIIRIGNFCCSRQHCQLWDSATSSRAETEMNARIGNFYHYLLSQDRIPLSFIQTRITVSQCRRWLQYSFSITYIYVVVGPTALLADPRIYRRWRSDGVWRWCDEVLYFWTWTAVWSILRTSNS